MPVLSDGTVVKVKAPTGDTEFVRVKAPTTQHLRVVPGMPGPPGADGAAAPLDIDPVLIFENALF